MDSGRLAIVRRRLTSISDDLMERRRRTLQRYRERRRIRLNQQFRRHQLPNADRDAANPDRSIIRDDVQLTSEEDTISPTQNRFFD